MEREQELVVNLLHGENQKNRTGIQKDLEMEFNQEGEVCTDFTWESLESLSGYIISDILPVVDDDEPDKIKGVSLNLVPSVPDPQSNSVSLLHYFDGTIKLFYRL